LDFKEISKAAAGLLGAAGTVIVLTVLATTAIAQPRPDAGSILESIKEKPVAPPRGAGDPLPRAPEPRPALGAPGLKVVVTAFKISGNTIYPEAVLLEQVKEFVGKEQTIDGLNDAATKVRAYYRERGYFLSQAYLPQQEIKGGVVEIAVIEARVGKVAVNFKEGTRYSEGLVRGLVNAHLKEGELITEQGLETPLLLLNDFPNAVVTSEIKPSATIGAADLTVNVSDSPGIISGSVDIDNYGNRFTGQYRMGVSLSFNNPLGMGDQFSYRGFVTDDRMGFYRAAYVIPVGYWGTRVGLSYASFHYRLGKTLIERGVHGVGGVTTVYAFHPFIRTRSSNLIGQFAYEEKKLNDRDETAGTNTDRKINSSKIGVVGDFRDGLFGGGLNSYGVTITEGTVRINGDTAPALRTDGHFHKKNFEFRRLQKITDNTTLLLALSGQMGSKNLTSAEKFSLGGPQGVRAYPVGEGVGDTGWLFQGELRYILPGVKVGPGDITLVGFWDQGWVRLCENFVAANCVIPIPGNPNNNANNRNLSGYGIGASVGRDAEFIFRIHAAWRSDNEAPQSDTTHRIPRVWAQAIKWF
jgi:hemolysin activation/secretion protein